MTWTNDMTTHYRTDGRVTFAAKLCCVVGVGETKIMASLADTTLLAIKWGSTRREVVRNALNSLKSMGWSDGMISSRVRAVVTQVDLKKHARYRYGDSVEHFVHHRGYYRSHRPPIVSRRLSRSTETVSGEDVIEQMAAE